jgi:hypothetical protein
MSPSFLSHFSRLRAPFLLLLALQCLLPLPAQAGGHGEGGGGPAPMSFVINVGKTGTGGLILQLSIVIEPAKPEAAKLIDDFKPMLQHRVLLVVSGMKPEKLRSPAGRQELADTLVEELNADLGTTDKDGIKEIFFTSFIFQQM